jgi:hypothetical protein
LQPGFNVVVAPNDSGVYDGRTLDTTPITDDGMYVYDFNRLGQKNWRTTALGASIPQLFNQVGYYVYNNTGNTVTENLPIITKSEASTIEEKVKVRRGWNLMSIAATNTARKLSAFHVYTIKPDADNACMDDSCFEQKTLYDLLVGTSSTQRAYPVIYEITNTHTSDASQAFTTLKVDSTNIDTATIPASTAFWFYLWN